MKIAPSILSLDYSKFNEQLAILNKKCEWIHFDVMDGNFVPNITFGPDIFKAFRKHSDLYLDVHLMVKDPSYYSQVFIDNGADGITFHVENFQSIDEGLALIQKIQNQYVKAGLSLRPNTSIETFLPYLQYLDVVLVMSVEPGFGGQKFNEQQLEKVRYLKAYREQNKLNYLIEIDGGINGQTAFKAIEAGCDVLVAGSYIFNGDIEHNIDNISFKD